MEKFNKLIKNIIFFFAVFLVVNYIMQSCLPSNEVTPDQQNTLVFETTKNQYSRSKVITLSLKNNTQTAIEIPNECPNEPFDVFRYEGNEWVQKQSAPDLDCSQSTAITLEPGQKTLIAYNNWNHDLFSEMGRFKIQFNTNINDEFTTYTSPEFTVVKEGILTQLWNGLLYRPIYNGLIYLTSIMPGHNLGLAIILLTLIIRTILLIPSQKAIQSQKKMQDIQPRLDKIKEKYKGDQQKIAMETMAVWKESGVKPMGSCLPLLLQFPFLIAIFYVVRNGLNPDNLYLLYSPIQNFDLTTINSMFLGLDLKLKNLYVLPVIVGGLQFFQMQMMMAKNKKKKSEKDQNEVAKAQGMMVYIMPIMIAVFTASVPAGVGIYWGTSTIYGIIQQLFVTKSPSKKNDEPQVRVIKSDEK